MSIVVDKEASCGAPRRRGSVQQFLVLVAITVVIWVLESLFEYLQKIIWRNLAQSVSDVRLDAYRHVQGLEMGFFEDQDSAS